MTKKTYIEKVSEINWETLYGINNVDLAWNFIETNLNDILSDIAPIVKVQPSNRHKKWVTRDTKDLMRLRDDAKLTAKQSGSPEHWKDYRTLRNTVTSQVRKDRRTFLQDQYKKCDDTNDIGQLYKTVKSQLGWNPTGPPTTLVDNGRTITAPKDLAQLQMDYFHNKNIELHNSVNSDNEDINPLETLNSCINKWKQWHQKGVATAASTTTSSGGSHCPPNNNNITQQQWSQREVATAASTITSSGGSHRPPQQHNTKGSGNSCLHNNIQWRQPPPLPTTKQHNTTTVVSKGSGNSCLHNNIQWRQPPPSQQHNTKGSGNSCLHNNIQWRQPPPSQRETTTSSKL